VDYSRSLEPKDLALILDPWSTAFRSVLHEVRFSNFACEAFGCFVFLIGLSCYTFLRAFSFCLSHLRMDPCAEGQRVWEEMARQGREWKPI
jgi:hypothetical protein